MELQRVDRGRAWYFTTHNVNAARTISTDRVWLGGSGGYALTGLTDTLGIWDGGIVRATHQEFGGRVIVEDGTASQEDHATHVGGTMIAAGIEASARGMSSQARLRSFDWNSDSQEMALAAAEGLQVSNHSYGYIAGWCYNYRGDGKWVWFGDTTISGTADYLFGFYNSYAQDWDNIAFNAPNYLIVKSAGNDRGYGPSTQPVEHWVWGDGQWRSSRTIREKNGGTTGYDCLSSNTTAKNILTVGAVNDIPGGYVQSSDVVMSSFSSWGPTDDGRIKPDIVANGIQLYSSLSGADDDYGTSSGTSMATPNVSGSLGLLLEHHRNLNGTGPLRAATLKALIIHTSDEAGSADGPDYRFGWGLMNTLHAADVLQQDSQMGRNSLVHELVLTQGDTIVIPIFSDGTLPLRATACWTDPAGTPPPASLNPTTAMLVNDLDLRIVRNAESYAPWVLDPANPDNPATTGENVRDNVEQVEIASPVAGGYTVRITHKGTLTGGSQAVSLILTGQAGITVNLKAFLQGPFYGGSMIAALGSALPLSQPYDSAPWSYAGTESVDSIPSDVVDWVLVELRTDTASTTTVSTRAAFIRNDGIVVDLDGTSPVAFSRTAGDHYLVLRHRNHLPVMSATAVALSASSPLQDFTSAANTAYGVDAMKGMGGGNTAPFALYGGEANGDGYITSSDFNVFNPRFTAGATGYEISDWNLDGYVTSSDFNVFLANFTAGKATRVP